VFASSVKGDDYRCATLWRGRVVLLEGRNRQTGRHKTKSLFPVNPFSYSLEVSVFGGGHGAMRRCLLVAV